MKLTLAALFLLAAYGCIQWSLALDRQTAIIQADTVRIAAGVGR